MFGSDNGTKFFNKDISPFLSSHGILHQSSCVHTPQQNARVERKHRHLPTLVLQYKSLHELLFGYPPRYDALKVFGCLTYASIHPKDKFAHRTIRGVFIGYPGGQKGYKILDLQTKKIFVIRHVKLHETIFPFLTSQSKITSGNDPHTILPWVDSFASNTDYTSLHDNFTVESSTEPSIISAPVVHSNNPYTPEHSISEVSILQLSSHNSTEQFSIISSTNNPDVPDRVSTRTKITPQWWKDYDISGKPANLLSTVNSQDSQEIPLWAQVGL